ncbi:MAG TPA: trypsin-like peptidase domain-containing protein [Thermodesulfobacteriota bacterium]|nr:trypsin-like peptidase domain-containing protein [Thermodesulfobacteriota bacterium]
MKIRLIIVAAFILITCVSRSSESRSVAEIFKQVNGSVTVIVALHKVSSVPAGLQQTTGLDLGSGVLVSKNGKVITSAHLVNAADQIAVKFSSGETVSARVVASAPLADVSLLQLESVPKEVVVAKLGDSERVEVGDEVFVVGAPYGLSHTLTVGHISARHKPIAILGGFEVGEFFQTDAAINQGNSGGPMFNMAGEVIGIASRILTKSGGSEGLGFAVTSNTARRLLLEEQSFWFGLDGIVLADEFAGAFNVPQSMGFLVQEVADNSPAARLGLQPGRTKSQIGSSEILLGGDIILEVVGIQVSEDCYEKIRKRLSDMKPGDTITVKVLRAGRILQLYTTRGR